jgi:hypothetical protein
VHNKLLEKIYGAAFSSTPYSKNKFFVFSSVTNVYLPVGETFSSEIIQLPKRHLAEIVYFTLKQQLKYFENQARVNQIFLLLFLCALKILITA